jgi:methylated-DNA-[protein]-cysteine S-methyltransferase
MTTDDQRIVRRLESASRRLEPREPELAVLRLRLAEEAERGGLLDVGYRTVDTPLGRLLVAATANGLVRLAFESEGEESVLEELAAKVSPRILHAPRRLDTTARELEEYFEGARRRFDVPVDLRLASGFRREVLVHLSSIEFGQTESYRDVAVAIEHPNAVRAVGTACATNPIPLVIPCHRVIRSDGQLGAYRGGAGAKERLLTMESAP